MPNGQADVTAGAPNLQSFFDKQDGTITDNVTLLMWQKNVAPGTYMWADAVAYCPTLTLGGHSDWRLPSRIELVSLVDFGSQAPTINSNYFPSTPANFFWSSTLAVPAGNAWGVTYNNGMPVYDDTSHSYPVRCVR